MDVLKFMRWVTMITIAMSVIGTSVCAQTKLAFGDQPQLSLDKDGIVRMIYGQGDRIYYSSSTDNGKTFDLPSLVAEINGMHLGMTRGPQLATSRDYTLVTAIDKKGNIHSFRLSHKTRKWEDIGNVNDAEGSAPEGLMSIAADEENHFYAIWLDLRENQQNNICFSILMDKGKWKENRFIYKSPDGHVCECCKPSIAVKGRQVSVMFRNWVMGSRDLYFISSSDQGKNFTAAQKLGIGTWQLKGCPMDGGGISIGQGNDIQTAWQREYQVFYSKPEEVEQSLGEGRSVGLNGDLIYWQKGSELIIKPINGQPTPIGQGTALSAIELKDGSVLAVWQQDKQIIYQVMK